MNSCDFCGREAELYQGACLDCRNRLKLNDPPPRDDLQTPPYTRHLAERVRNALGELVALPSQRVIEYIISEALFQAAQDAKRGRVAQLEYIGQICRIDNGQGQLVRFVADDWLSGITRPFGNELLRGVA